MRTQWKKPLVLTLMAVLIGGIPTTVSAATKLHSTKQTQTVTRGVTYTEERRLTDAGFQDIYVLEMDLNESSLSFHEVETTGEYGLKETVQKMLQDNGAVAGVNGDFFGLSGTYSTPFGPTIRDGEIISIGTNLNVDEAQYASFFQDEDGNTLFNYFKMTVNFLNERGDSLSLLSLNKVTAMVFPIYFDQAENTADLDKRFADSKLVKFVVEDDVITKISAPGEVVDVPEDGYLIILSNNYYNDHGTKFAVGDEVYLDINASVDLDEMENAFAGGGMLLTNGQTAPATSIVGTGRQPRTAFGISQDGTKAIFMVVDGRNTSIGATHQELAALMVEYGAYNAMHLDGGGSSTMVVETNEDTSLELKNTPSDGAARKTINAIGIFQNAPETDEVAKLVITPVETAVTGQPVTYEVYGLDSYERRINLDSSELKFDLSAGSGTISGSTVTPSQAGLMAVGVSYGDLYTMTFTTVHSPAKLTATISNAKLSAGGTATVKATVVDSEGFSYTAQNGVTYQVADTSVGTMSGNTFTAKKEGATYITCQLGNLTYHIPVTVGNAKAVSAPSAVTAKDNWNQTITKTDDGALYVKMAGNIASSAVKDLDLYTAKRAAVRTALDTNSNLAVFAGTVDLNQGPQTETLRWNSGYNYTVKNGTAFVSLSAAKGALYTTNAAQWSKMTTDLSGFTGNNVVILLDKTPSNFSNTTERDFFRDYLEELSSNGKSVAVISCEGTSSWVGQINGVRYINLPALWNSDGTYNSNARILSMKCDSNGITYDWIA